MARLLFWLVVLPVAVGIVVFAVVNRQAVDVSLWPAPYALSVPAWALIVAGMVLGFVVGGLAAWAGGAPMRADARALRRRINGLERDVLLEKEKNAKLEKNLSSAALTGQGDGGALAPVSHNRG